MRLWLANTMAGLRGERRSISADTLRIYVLQGGALTCALGANVLLARVLGPDGKGRFDLFQLTLTMLPEIGLFGLASGLLYHLANRGRPIAEVHGTGLVASLVLGGGLAGLGWVGLPWWQRLLPGVPAWALLLGFGLAPATCYRLVWTVCMTGIDRAVRTHVFTLVVGVVGLVAYGGLWLAGRLAPNAAVIAAGAVTGGSALLAFAMLRPAGGPLRPRADLARAAFRTGAVLWVGLLANILHFKVDQIMLNGLIGPGAVGIYGVAVRWAELLFVLDAALISAALYKISSLGERESYALVRRLAWGQCAVSAVSGGALAALAWPLVHGLYGAVYGAAVWPLVILVPGVVSWSLAKVLSQYLAFQRGAMWIPTSFAVAGLGVNVGLNLAWIPRWGVTGAAAASACSYALVMACTVVAFAWMGSRR